MSININCRILSYNKTRLSINHVKIKNSLLINLLMETSLMLKYKIIERIYCYK